MNSRSTKVFLNLVSQKPLPHGTSLASEVLRLCYDTNSGIFIDHNLLRSDEPKPHNSWETLCTLVYKVSPTLRFSQLRGDALGAFV